LGQHTIESYQWISTPSTIVVISNIPESTHDVFSEGNLSNISPITPLDISITPGIVENVHIGASCSPDEIVTYKSLFKEFHDVFAWSYEEMSGIDPDIMIHEIKTYPDVKPVQQHLHPVHPRKVVAIKLEVDKLHKVSLIYPVALTNWVSNLVPIDKKQGTIRMCVDYRDINKACPKTTFLPPLSFRLSTIAPEVKSHLYWMVSPDIIKSILFPRINTKQLLFVLGALLLIRNFLSVLKTLAQLSSALCLMPSMISSTSCNHILMTYLLIPCTGSIIPYTSEPFSSAIGFIIYA
jgi:hypothetical protein